ncbi:DUF1972 domain-containing protein [Aeromonas caviae]|uniref:DUF1972 domain-containing protein n=1 Tax=Aeromonas caviae TaxID=648 RepID=UPI0021C2AC71|nr:DUF1972 domain-containing protein [Aeromonas caviae]BDO07883.1 rhamnosyltransferase [Aeromonas caviae]
MIFLVCLNALKKPDVTLILGVSGCLFLPIYRLFNSSKVITNIDGLEWRRDKWGWFAKHFLKISEKIAVRFSDIVVSDNQAISDYVLSEYGMATSVIAYGGDHALIDMDKIPVKKGEYYLSICRIEPENNVDMILYAFSKSSETIFFVGNWDASDYGRKLKRKYFEFENINIIDPVYDIEVLFKLRSQCKGYIHGHSAGGTNPSLVEAMQFGMPIYAFDCNFNRYSTKNKALYFYSANSLCELIGIYDESVIESGLIMKSIAMENYQWKIIVDRYESLY